ncbi:MAG: type IV pilus modification PilV family protein [Pirellulaceae bacterium]
MTQMLSWKRHRRCGFSMAEMVVAVAITTLVMVGGLQLITLAARQGGAIENHRLASLEAGNIMEQIMCRPWDELTSEGLSSLPLSEACRQALPAASLQVAIDTDGTDQDARRITVQLDWAVNSVHRSKPVHLVAWRYREREVQP